MQPGDVVQLKRGGPLMTVQSVDSSGVICTWFDDKHKLQNARFPQVMLEKVEPGAIGGLQLG